MILFLDTVSPLPEFSIIEDNKIIYSKEIMSNSDKKMSDYIIPAYVNLEKNFSLSKKLKYLIVNTGPGSYTALRIGIAFFSGLSLSMNIDLKGITCVDLYKYSLEKNSFNSTIILIKSSNNQNFLCFYDQKKNIYQIHKIEKNLQNIEVYELRSKKIITNAKLTEEEMKLLGIFEYQEFKFKELVSKNINNILSHPHQNIIEPIYISNNQILN